MEQIDLFGQRYESFNLPRQLLRVYSKDKSKVGDVYSYAISQAKTKNNHLLYKSLHSEANTQGVSLNSTADYDPEWLQKREQEFQSEFSKKESELKLHIANNLKPSIQMSFLDLARLALRAGSLKDFEQFATKAQEVQPANSEANYYYKICLLLNNKHDDLKKIVDNEADVENFKSASASYTHGRVISGIVKLRSKDLFGAFTTLSDISIENLNEIGIYTSFYDLARYIAVLGVVCCKREEIQGKLFTENTKQLLNHNQTAIKLIESFVNANYEETSRALEIMMGEWNNDPYVENAGITVYGLVLEKLIKQYLSTVSRVKLQTLCDTFRVHPNQCDETLKGLILANKIPFRINVIEQTLVHRDESVYEQDKLVKKAVGIIGNYCFEKQFAVLKVGLNNISGTRQKGKGLVEAYLE